MSLLSACKWRRRNCWMSRKKSPATLEMYGIKGDAKQPFAANCLLARRLVERGVRFVELFHDGWDHHSDLNSGLKKQCEATDQPAAALVKDLKQRGLLDSTLVIWGGEFGRTPMVENRKPDGKDSLGRDHHPPGVQYVGCRRRNQGRAGDRQNRRSGVQHRGRQSRRA